MGFRIYGLGADVELGPKLGVGRLAWAWGFDDRGMSGLRIVKMSVGRILDKYVRLIRTHGVAESDSETR